MALLDQLEAGEREETLQTYQSSKHLVELAIKCLEEAETAARTLGRAGSGASLSPAREAFGRLRLESMLYLAAKSGQGWIMETVTRYLAKTMSAKPAINGEDLLKMGLSPSRRLGEVLEEVYSAQLDGKVNSREEALELAKSLIRQ